MLTLTELDAFCRDLPGCEVRYPFKSGPDLRAWCVRQRMFAWSITTKTPLAVQVKANPDLVPMLIRNYACVTPGYHMNKRHWITVDVATCEAQMLQGLLEDAHALIVGKLPVSMRLSLLGN